MQLGLGESQKCPGAKKREGIENPRVGKSVGNVAAVGDGGQVVPTELGGKRPPPDGEWEHDVCLEPGPLKDYSLTLCENMK